MKLKDMPVGAIFYHKRACGCQYRLLSMSGELAHIEQIAVGKYCDEGIGGGPCDTIADLGCDYDPLATALEQTFQKYSACQFRFLCVSLTTWNMCIRSIGREVLPRD